MSVTETDDPSGALPSPPYSHDLQDRPACMRRQIHRQIAGAGHLIASIVQVVAIVGGAIALAMGARPRLPFGLTLHGFWLEDRFTRPADMIQNFLAFSCLLFVVAYVIVRLAFHLKPSLDASRMMNSLSAPGDPTFLAYLFDLVFDRLGRGTGASSTTGATVYDIGGVGQIDPLSDPKRRIARVVNINPDRRTPCDFGTIGEAPPESGDIAILSGVVEYFAAGEDVEILCKVRSRLKPGGWVVVCDTEFHPWPLFEPPLRQLQSLSTAFLLWRRFSYRSAPQVETLLRAAGFAQVQLLPHRYVPKFGPGAAFIVIGRRSTDDENRGGEDIGTRDMRGCNL